MLKCDNFRVTRFYPTNSQLFACQFSPGKFLRGQLFAKTHHEWFLPPGATKLYLRQCNRTFQNSLPYTADDNVIYELKLLFYKQRQQWALALNILAEVSIRLLGLTDGELFVLKLRGWSKSSTSSFVAFLL